MKQKKVLSVHDISCYGKCSNTVALPVLSAGGLETVILPTALLSTHTGGFSGYSFLDLTDEMEKTLNHYKSFGLKFDILYTGYFGSPRQMELVESCLPSILKDGALKVIDPVLGDNGSLYSIYNDEFVEKMRMFCKNADYITPNVTEACLLIGEKFTGNEYEKERFDVIFAKLHALGVKHVMITGVVFSENSIGVALHSDGDKSAQTIASEYIKVHFHGTGDVLASAFVAYLSKGISFEVAAMKCVRFVSACIAQTLPVFDEHWYGLMFEPCLKMITEEGRI